MIATQRGPCVIALAIAFGLGACGDNSAACGDGTMLNGSGYCVPSDACGTGTVLDPVTNQCVPDGTIVCAPGTVFDPATASCQVDTSVCQDGTVLVGGHCVDPTAGLTIDLEEAPEPNGLGYLEASAVPAGTIAALPAIGAPSYVIHGHLDPWQDADQDGQIDPDVDTYLVTVTAPTLLRVSATGLHGITAGFVAGAQVGATDPLASWLRFGMNVTGETSVRTVLLPRAGTYALAIADTRTLFPLATGGPVGAAPGGPSGDYYVSIDPLAIPVPTMIPFAGNTSTQAGTTTGDVQFFTAKMGAGFNQAQLAMPAPQARAAAVVLDGAELRGTGAAPDAAKPATALAGGILPGDTALIAVDDVYDTAAQPIPFQLAVQDAFASPLPTTMDGSALQPEHSANPTTIADLNTFYYDVSAADDVVGMQLAWSTPVDGMLVGPDLQVLARFTRAPSGFVGDTFAGYTGLVRFPTPGRYYFLVYDPAHGGTGTLSVTSTIADPLAPAALALDTPTTQATSAFGTTPFTFDSTSSPWDVFAGNGAGTGDLAVAFYDPSAAYGRLDPLAVTCSGRGACPAGPATLPPEPASLFAYDFPQAGASYGRIVLGQPTQHYFVAVTPTTPGTFSLAFASRAVDHYTVAAGDSAMASNSIDTTTPEHYYLLESAPGNAVAITVTPASLGLDTSIQLVGDDETPRGPPANDGAAGQPDHATATLPAAAPSYVAWTVAGTPVSSTSLGYSVTATVSAP